MIFKRCLNCNKKFEDRTFNKIAKFCSQKCADKVHWQRRKEKIKNAVLNIQFENWQNVKCPNCGFIFTYKRKRK